MERTINLSREALQMYWLPFQFNGFIKIFLTYFNCLKPKNLSFPSPIYSHPILLSISHSLSYDFFSLSLSLSLPIYSHSLSLSLFSHLFLSFTLFPSFSPSFKLISFSSSSSFALIPSFSFSHSLSSHFPSP